MRPQKAAGSATAKRPVVAKREAAERAPLPGEGKRDEVGGRNHPSRVAGDLHHRPHARLTSSSQQRGCACAAAVTRAFVSREDLSFTIVMARHLTLGM